MSIIMDNPKAVKDFMSKQTPERLKAGQSILDTFREHAGDLTDEQLETVLTLFAGMLGTLSEEPEVILQLVDAYSVLRNGEDIMTAAACLVRQ